MMVFTCIESFFNLVCVFGELFKVSLFNISVQNYLAIW